ncbi:hypothetical protein [Aridibaculum aurantiacum]|uniref:hypothetical protein n=1 Tax=Aridibaculum aurantiacum TaxID=2810307 RepID=UPI001A963A65|nr:hypothetical protein [Aridibaculum aurantiacum]
MSENTYVIKIKKEYASAILEDLKQVDAIEILQGSIPEWQEVESLKRLQQMKDDPSGTLSEEEFFKKLNEPH